MCYSKTIEFSGCRHKWPQHLTCDDVKNGQKCRKLRQGTEVYHQACPRCDPGYWARTNTEPIEGLKLSKSVQELQIAAAHAIEIERYQAYDSKTSSELSGEFDRNGRRKSGTSFGSDDGGIKGKFRGMLGKSLDRMGTLGKTQKLKDSSAGAVLKHSKTTGTALHRKQRSDGSESFKPTSPLAFDLTSPLARKPTNIIMRDKDGRFHAPSKSKDAGVDRVVWADNVQGTSHGHTLEKPSARSSGNTSFEEPSSSSSELWRTSTGRPIPGYSLSVESGIAERRKLEEMLKREIPQPPEHSTSVDLGDYESAMLEGMWRKERGQMQIPEHSRSLGTGKDESKVLEEMWMKERALMQSPEPFGPSSVPPDWPRRHESRDWSQTFSEEEVLNLDRLSSERGRKDHTRPDTFFPSSELPSRQPQIVEEASPGTSRQASVAHKTSANLPQSSRPALQTCPPTGERRRLVEAQEEVIRAAEVEQSRGERTRNSGQRAQGEERKHIAQRNRSEDWDDLSPPPLRTLHNQKPSVDAVLEDPSIPKPTHINDWEKCGVDYLEEHCGTFSATWTSLQLAEEYRFLIGRHPIETDISEWTGRW